MSENNLHPNQLSLAFIASHDLQEPLRKIQLFTAFIAEDQHSQLSDEAKGYLLRITRSIERMQHLTESLLSYWNLTESDIAGKFEHIDLHQMIADIRVQLSDKILAAGATIEIMEMPIVYSDPFLISVLFTNLLENAVLFKNPAHASQITLTSETVLRDKARYHKITITDTGIGFSDESASRIFEPLQRLHSKDKFEGAGMGLTISSEIAKLQGGFITASGAPGEGATFSVFIPVNQ
ncbi:MAG: hypothetical protein DI539_05170 [Flavobacterium psychrophilum]|nr:MAG: hypothetical protein DI539_05170 [Flavobacterium psychrophilum]